VCLHVYDKEASVYLVSFFCLFLLLSIEHFDEVITHSVSTNTYVRGLDSYSGVGASTSASSTDTGNGAGLVTTLRWAAVTG
jgi:hypothetical protein